MFTRSDILQGQALSIRIKKKFIDRKDRQAEVTADSNNKLTEAQTVVHNKKDRKYRRTKKKDREIRYIDRIEKTDSIDRNTHRKDN